MKFAIVLLIAVIIILFARLLALPSLGRRSERTSCINCGCVAAPGNNKCPPCIYPDPEEAPDPFPENFEPNAPPVFERKPQ